MEDETRKEFAGYRDDDRVRLIEAIYRIVGQVEKRFDALRESDLTAIRLAHSELSLRLQGFPQQYATKIEFEQAAELLRRLENESLSREIYQQNHQALLQSIAVLDRDKLSKSIFEAFAEGYRLDQDRAADERRNVAEVLATATEGVRAQMLEERGDFLTQDVYDQRHQALSNQVAAVERWEYKIVGALVFATFIAPLVTGVVVYLFTKSLPK